MQPNPILLVHGIDDSGSRFARLSSFLTENGLGPVLAMDIHPPDASIPMEAMAGQVASAVQTLLQTHSARQVDIAAYSMGTLAVRYYIQRLGGKTRVRRFVSLAGPHHGTLAAYLRENAGCRQMRPGSAFLADLNRDEDPWGRVEVFSFWTPLDLMIFPAGTSRLTGAKNRRFFVLAHPLMVSDPQVMQAAALALSK